MAVRLANLLYQEGGREANFSDNDASCEGKNTLLTVIDRWTGWPEAFPMTMHGDAANTKACAKVLVRQWIARWGVPDIITSDRGSQFASDIWFRVLCSITSGSPLLRYNIYCISIVNTNQAQLMVVYKASNVCILLTFVSAIL